MTIEFSCTCGQKLQAPDGQAGWRVRCPRCNAEATVPAARSAASPSPAIQPSIPPYPGPYPAPAYYGPMYLRRKTNGMAIASLVLGILGFAAYGICAILAIIFGHCALSTINKSGGRLGGRGMAIAGLVQGYIWLGIYLILLIVILAVVASEL